jgi:hypothetical protein
MPDVESVLVGNLTESLRRADRYLVLGLLSAMLLAVYTFLPTSSEGISLAPVGLPALPRTAALGLLVVIYFAAPFLGSFALARANRIGLELRSNEALLRAVLTYPCIATTRVHGPRLAVAFIPPLLAVAAAWKQGILVASFDSLIWMPLSIAPYVILWQFHLRTAIGGLQPDRLGD